MHELFGVIKGAAESDKQKRAYRKGMFVAIFLLVCMLVANMALTAAVVFLAKDTVTGAVGVSTTPSGTLAPATRLLQRRPADKI